MVMMIVIVTIQSKMARKNVNNSYECSMIMI